MKSHLAWNYIDQKKSINACTAFELNISEIPDTRKMSQMMEKLSQFYPGLKSTFEDGPFGSVRLVENKDHNIFVRDKVYDNLEHFTVDRLISISSAARDFTTSPPVNLLTVKLVWPLMPTIRSQTPWFTRPSLRHFSQLSYEIKN